jgi:hypothetical protein
MLFLDWCNKKVILMLTFHHHRYQVVQRRLTGDTTEEMMKLLVICDYTYYISTTDMPDHNTINYVLNEKYVLVIAENVLTAGDSCGEQFHNLYDPKRTAVPAPAAPDTQKVFSAADA